MFLYFPSWLLGKLTPKESWESIWFCIQAMNKNIMNSNFIPTDNFRIMYSCLYDISLNHKTIKKDKIQILF